VKHESISSDLGCTRAFAERAEVSLSCEVRQGARPWTRAQLDDISQAGFRIACMPGAKRGTPLRIRIPGLEILNAEIRWLQDEAVGCEFTSPLHVAVFEHIVRQCRIG